MPTPYDIDLDRNPANFQPLTPLSFLARTAEVYPDLTAVIHGGLTRKNGDTLRSKILSRGRTREPQALFEDFYGKPPDVGPLLQYHGLSPAPHDPAR